MTKEEFKRTSCSCDKCRSGCLHCPCALAPEDLPHFDESNLVVRTPIAPPGMLAVTPRGFPALPVLAPAQREDGSCVFYEDGKCTVHDHSPMGCRMFKVCEERPDDAEISRYIDEQVAQSHAVGDRYAQLCATLPEGRPNRLRRTAMRIALAAIDRRAQRKVMQQRGKFERKKAKRQRKLLARSRR